jgi:hypothetical protein
MKTKALYGLICAAAALSLAGCGQSTSYDSETPAARNTNVTVKEVGKKAEEAVTAAKDLAAETKDHFVTASNAKLTEWNDKLAALGKKADALGSEGKADAAKALDTLHAKSADAARKLDELKQSSQDTWQKAKAGVDAALADLQRAYEDAKSKFEKDKP